MIIQHTKRGVGRKFDSGIDLACITYFPVNETNYEIERETYKHGERDLAVRGLCLSIVSSVGWSVGAV